MDRKRYYIYRLEAPSGRAYIGLTSQTLKERWRQHVNRALTSKNHPLLQSIRKYGAESFKVYFIACTTGLTNAKLTEITCIAYEENPYNLSPGGEYDGPSARKIFWENIRKDPIALAEYRTKLREAQALRTINGEDRGRLPEEGRKWREGNPREAYKIRSRATRVAARLNTTTGLNAAKRLRQESKGLKERLLAKHKGVFLSKQDSVRKVWAERSSELKTELFSKISKSVKRHYDENPAKLEETKVQLATARNNIDRIKQGRAASAGIKKYWADLKANPEKYAEVMAAKKMKLRGKKNESSNV